MTHAIRLPIFSAIAAILFAGTAAAQQPGSPPVTVAKPIVKDLIEWDEVTGRFEATAAVDVRARVNGFLESVHFTDGAVVKQGDLLFVIDRRSYQAVVNHAQAVLNATQTRFDFSRVESDGRLIDLASYGIDASVRFGSGQYPGMDVVRLFDDRTVPVCSPAALAKYGPIRKPEDVVKFPLLHDTYAEHNVHSESGADWWTWGRRVGAGDIPGSGGLRFSNANLAIDAAANGLGLALARTSLLGSDLKTGRLVCPLPFAVATTFSYDFLVLPQRAGESKLRAFRDWLLEEAKKPAFDSNGIDFKFFEREPG